MTPVETPSRNRNDEIWAQLKSRDIQFIGLQFTDLFGAVKCVHVHIDEFETVMAGQTMFDGSSVKGFAKVDNSELRLMPDADTFRYDAYRPEDQGVAYV
ncbi:MAG: L-glutamine synthetase, partial [Paenibacillus sp.]|nr:L-glutamine synthetase [Paenibacillus sp.]